MGQKALLKEKMWVGGGGGNFWQSRRCSRAGSCPRWGLLENSASLNPKPPHPEPTPPCIQRQEISKKEKAIPGVPAGSHGLTLGVQIADG